MCYKEIGKAILKGMTDMNNISIDQAILDELIEGILTIIHDELVVIILYGSVARSSATAESDVDIALIMKNPLTKECEESFSGVLFIVDFQIYLLYHPFCDILYVSHCTTGVIFCGRESEY